MLNEIILAITQAATEFLPISSSGHLALVSNLISEPNLFFFTMLHLASLIAVLIFTRHEIIELVSFKKSARIIWVYWILATIPAAAVGYFFNDLIESAFNSYLFLAVAFFFTGVVLLLTKLSSGGRGLGMKNTFVMGLFQVLALFPGVSRSGMTISAGMFQGLDREKAAKFSFLMFIPIAVGAFVLEFGAAYFSWSLVVSFILCMVLSLLFLQLLLKVVVRGKFWMFSFYCFAVGIVSLVLWFLS